MMLSSIQAIIPMSHLSLNMWLIMLWNVAGPLTSSNGNAVYLNKSYPQRNAVFHLSTFLIRMRWLPFLRFILVNQFAPQIRSWRSSIFGWGY